MGSGGSIGHVAIQAVIGGGKALLNNVVALPSALPPQSLISNVGVTATTAVKSSGRGPKPRIILITEIYYKGKALPLGTTATYNDDAVKGKQIIKVGTETIDEGEDMGDIVTIKRSYDGPTAYGGYNVTERVVEIKPKANRIPPKFVGKEPTDNPLKIDLPKIELKIDFDTLGDEPRDPIDKPGTVPVHLRFLQKFKKLKP